MGKSGISFPEMEKPTPRHKQGGALRFGGLPEDRSRIKNYVEAVFEEPVDRRMLISLVDAKKWIRGFLARSGSRAI
jgi:hypothetical protein